MANKRDGLGVVKRTAPRIGANLNSTDVQRAIDTIYSDLNSIFDSVNRPNSTSAIEHFKGKTGDIRLYKGSGLDGSTGYFLQGKFDDGWATVHLTLDENNPANQDVTSPSAQSSGPEPFITKYGVTYSNLTVNSAVGDQGNQVARGNHIHADHWTDLYDSLTSTEQQAMLNTIHFPLHTANISNNLVSDDPSNTGTSLSAARADHTHKLDMDTDYTWKGTNTFGQSYGNDGVTTTFNGPQTGSGLALDIYGDVAIDGNLTVTYADTQSGAVDLQNSVTLNSNNETNGTFSSYTFKTEVLGPTKVRSGFSVKKDVINNNNQWHHDGADDGKPPFLVENTGSEGQMRLQYGETKYFDFKVDINGNISFEPTGNIELKPTTRYVLPESNYYTHLGDIDRAYGAIHAGELVVQNLVAQNVMSTIGGQIMVAPTNTFMSDYSDDAVENNAFIDLQHNDPNFRNAWLFAQKSTSTGSQIEAFRTLDVAPNQITLGNGDTAYRYTLGQRNGDGSGSNNWKAGDTIVVLYKIGTNNGSKGHIELTSTGSTLSSYGPRITLFAANSSDTTWDAAKPLVAIGALRGYASYNTDDDYGIIISDDATQAATDMKGMTLDKDNGLRLFNTDIEMYNSGSKKVELLSDGRFRLGANLTLDANGDWNTGDNVGLSWDGSSLVINGTINVTGGSLPSGTPFDNLENNIEDLSTQLDNLDTSGMDDYSAAQSIVSSVGGNIILDSDMEFEPSADSGYNDMRLWATHTNNYVSKTDEHSFNGDHSLKIVSRNHYITTEGNSFHTNAYQTDLTGQKTYFPVVPGMKVTAHAAIRMEWTNYGGDNNTIQNNLFRYGFQVFNADKSLYYWISVFRTNQSDNNLWQQYSGSVGIKNEYSYQGNSFTPAYIVPWVSADTWGSGANSTYEDDLQTAYFDDLQMYLDTSLAQPAAPVEDVASFYAGSDMFGLYDGSNWRTYFQQVGNDSKFILRDEGGTEQLSFDGDNLNLGYSNNSANITFNADSGNIELKGDLITSTTGSVMSSGGYNSSGNFFLGEIDGNKKFSVVGNSGTYIPGTTTQPKILFDASTGQLELDASLNRVYFAPLQSYSDSSVKIISKDNSNTRKILPIFHDQSLYWGTTSFYDNDDDPLMGSGNNNPGDVTPKTVYNVGYYSRVSIDATHRIANFTKDNDDIDNWKPRLIIRRWTGSDWSSWQGPYGVWNVDHGAAVTSSNSAGWGHGGHSHNTVLGGVQDINWVSVINIHGLVSQTGSYASSIQILPIDVLSEGRENIIAATYKIRVDNTRAQ